MRLMMGMIAMLALVARAVTVTGVVDTRADANARAVAGSVTIGSPTGGDGTTWNSTAYADGWRTVSYGGCSTNLLVLNDCALRGGRLAANETWSSGNISVLRNRVFVPGGKTLTVGAGTIVKFTPGTAVEVESGGTLVLQGVTLADIADDAVGGDTNCDGANSSPTGTDADWIAGAGAPAVTKVTLWNGGAREGNVRWYTSGQAYGTLPTLVREGCRFDGWFTSAEGGTQATAASTVASTALYAHWTAYAIDLSRSEMDVTTVAGEYSFDVSANCEWSVSAGDADWIELLTESGSGNGTISFAVAANGEITARSATITVSGQGMTREFTVRQAACEGVAAPKITPADGTEFAGAARRCAISCGTEGATIHYTLNGKDPDETDPVYPGVSFNVFDTTTIKARAYKAGFAASAITTARIVKKQSLAEALDIPLWTVTNDANAPWTIDFDVTHGTKASVRTGMIGCEEDTAISAEVSGEGMLSFWWKASCEDDPSEYDNWDFLACLVDGVEVARIDGDSGWRQVSVRLGEGAHAIRWVYTKDDMDDLGHMGEDCGWVDGVSWTPGAGVGPGEVSEAWLKEVAAAAGQENRTAAQIAASDPDGDGFTVEQEFIAGTDPNDPDSKLTADIRMVDGRPVVTWAPDLSEEEHPRVYTLYGSTDLRNWEEVPKGHEDDYNFFKVRVEMPAK